MELYVVVCEINQKIFVKQIYKTLEECHQYLQNLRENLAKIPPGNYRLVSYSDEKLVVEELDEEISHENRLRTYTIVSGETTEIMNYITSLNEQASDFD